ncbi:MAG: 2-oxo acid dehydrogenase subunit E2 [Candidatus Omnitrophica bacterium]|nr:2-oxo acid dehydrogenase subunit E2 [Candidatus Omnitrophota bacterium]
MIKEVIMPKLGQTMEEGIIEKWRKKEGENVEKGDILLDITTDKATLEVESYVTGILKKIVHNEGETVPVTQIIAYIGDEGDKVPDVTEEKKKPVEPAKQEVREVKAAQQEEKVEAAASRVKASPAARRIAREKKIDLGAIKGTGPGNRITEKDVLGFGKDAKVSSSPIRRVIAERMSRSKREIPHYYLTASLDMKEVIEMRKNLNQKLKKDGLKVSYNDFLIKASALTIAKYPSFNTRDSINIGLAVGIPEGILVPVIRNADKLSFLEIVKERGKLVDKARSNKLTPDEYSGGSFTISNLGAYEVENFCAIINPPEKAILAVGSIIETPAAVNGEVTIRPLMKVTLSLDHRIIDGVVAAAFLQRIKELVETPADISGGI